jgi:hypothetical protein
MRPQITMRPTVFVPSGTPYEVLVQIARGAAEPQDALVEAQPGVLPMRRRTAEAPSLRTFDAVA